LMVSCLRIPGFEMSETWQMSNHIPSLPAEMKGNSFL